MNYKTNVLNNKSVPLEFCSGDSIHHSFISNISGTNVGQTSEGCNYFLSKECSKGDNMFTNMACDHAINNKDSKTATYQYFTNSGYPTVLPSDTAGQNLLVEIFLRKYAILNSKCKLRKMPVIDNFSTSTIDFYAGNGCGIEKFQGLGVESIDSNAIIQKILAGNTSRYVAIKLFKPLVELGVAGSNTLVYKKYYTFLKSV